MKVAVLGAAGQLGSATVDEWRLAGHSVLSLTRADFDLSDASGVSSALRRHDPKLIINCAAYNLVDQAEETPLPALAVNAWALRTLAQVANGLDAALVTYSTDFVFDGEHARPYTEDDAPSPRSVYGMSKLLGEWFAQETDRAFVLRVESLFGGVTPRSSVDRMLAQILADEPVTAFVDRWVSPSYVTDVTRATRTLVENGHAPGLYHCVNSGYTTWFGIAEALREIAERPGAVINGVHTGQSGLRAPRPLFAALSNARLVAAGIAMPTWREALATHVSKVRAGA